MKALKGQGIEETCGRHLEDIYKECMDMMVLLQNSGKFLTRKGTRRHRVSEIIYNPSRGVFGKLDWGESEI